MPATDCSKERTTQHYLGGEGQGFGPVQHEEVVLLAVFDQTPKEGGRIATKAIERRQLTKGEFSLSRRRHITLEEFELQFNGKQVLIGVAIAVTATLRKLIYDFEVTKEQHRGRTICVLDIVNKGDHDAHAALEYSETLEAAMDGFSDKRKGILRGQINEDIAEAFDPIVPVATVFGA